MGLSIQWYFWQQFPDENTFLLFELKPTSRLVFKPFPFYSPLARRKRILINFFEWGFFAHLLLCKGKEKEEDKKRREESNFIADNIDKRGKTYQQTLNIFIPRGIFLEAIVILIFLANCCVLYCTSMPLIWEVTAAVDASGQKRRGFVAPSPPYVLLPPPPSQPGLMLWIATFYRTHSLFPSFLLFFCTHFSSSSPSHCIRMSYEARSSSSEGRESKGGLFLFAFFLKGSWEQFFFSGKKKKICRQWKLGVSLWTLSALKKVE